jgi:hypothetical protein
MQIPTTQAHGHRMTCNRKLFFGLAAGIATTAFMSCGTNARRQEITASVAVGTNYMLVLSIANPTPSIVLFQDPRLTPSAPSFSWELCAGRDVIATSHESHSPRDPLLAGHVSTGPVDIWPGHPLQRDLAEYFPQLTNKALLGKADVFLWSCRIWDQSAGRWIQTCGSARLHPAAP